MKIFSEVKKYFKNPAAFHYGEVRLPRSPENSSSTFRNVSQETPEGISPTPSNDDDVIAIGSNKHFNASWHQNTRHNGNKSTVPNVSKSGVRKEVERRPEKTIIWSKLNNCILPIDKEETKPELTVSPAYRDDTEPWDVSKKVISSPSFNIGTVNVKAEEIGLVFVILLLWAGAITLFINRWGKLRMLEPYQPQYTAPVASPPRQQIGNPPFININIQSTSSLSLNDNFRHSSPLGGSAGFPEWGGPSRDVVPGYLSPRRSIAGTQSMHVGAEHSSSSLNLYALNPQRRVRSAVDLVSLVMQEKLNNNGQFQHQIPQFAATNV